ncbi:MAG: putative addiction module antidote protein [Gammaproteobacteria bacterium]|nr:putative addiction module antidote protein [Gammaproteobacteria bacterium]
MTVNKTVQYKTGDYLNSPEEVAVYLEAVLEEDDPALLLVVLRNVAESQGGMAMMAENSGLSRESLYRTLSKNGNPKISTLMSIMKVLGLHLSVKVAYRK